MAQKLKYPIVVDVEDVTIHGRRIGVAGWGKQMEKAGKVIVRKPVRSSDNF